MLGVVWDHYSSKLKGKQYKQSTSSKSTKTEALVFLCSVAGVKRDLSTPTQTSSTIRWKNFKTEVSLVTNIFRSHYAGEI